MEMYLKYSLISLNVFGRMVLHTGLIRVDREEAPFVSQLCQCMAVYLDLNAMISE